MGAVKTGVAFIGAGIVAELYAQAFERGTPGRFVGVFDIDPGKAKTLAGRLGGRVFESRDALLGDGAVDAVIVMSPNNSHVEDAMACLTAGRHVLVEKPVAETHSDIVRLADAAARSGRACMPAHNYIYNPSIRRARRLIGEGRFGSITSLWILYNIFHSEEIARRYGGVLREVAVHHAYSLLFLLGRPISVSARKTRIHYDDLQAEDQVMLCCDLPNGALANLWVSFAASDPTSDPWTVVYKVLGTKGGISFSWNDALFSDGGGPAWGVVNYVDSFHEELCHFLAEVVPGRAPPLSSLSDAADALAIIEAGERSLGRQSSAVAVEYESEERANIRGP